MYFTKINFASKFPATTIFGFVTVPVKEGKLKHSTEKTTMQCEPDEATAYTVSAVVEKDGREWIADFKHKEDAESFTTLLQGIYMAAFNSRPADRMKQLFSIIDDDNSVLAVIEEGTDFEERLRQALAENYNGEVTQLSDEGTNKNYERIFDVTVREDGEEDEIYSGKITLIPVALYNEEKTSGTPPAESNEPYTVGDFSIYDLIANANHDLVYLTKSEATEILQLVSESDVDVEKLDWKILSFYTDQYIESKKRERLPSYDADTVKILKDYDLSTHFRIIPTTVAQSLFNVGIYALDLRDATDFLVETESEIQSLIDSADFAFGLEQATGIYQDVPEIKG